MPAHRLRKVQQQRRLGSRRPDRITLPDAQQLHLGPVLRPTTTGLRLTRHGRPAALVMQFRPRPGERQTHRPGCRRRQRARHLGQCRPIMKRYIERNFNGNMDPNIYELGHTDDLTSGRIPFVTVWQISWWVTGPYLRAGRRSILGPAPQTRCRSTRGSPPARSPRSRRTSARSPTPRGPAPRPARSPPAQPHPVPGRPGDPHQPLCLLSLQLVNEHLGLPRHRHHLRRAASQQPTSTPVRPDTASTFCDAALAPPNSR
jgi:hypothetical protein